MKKVRRLHPPTDLFTSLIIKGNKRGEEAILDTGMTRNKKRKRVKKQKNRQEKTEEEPKMPVAKIVAADDSSKKFKSNKRGAEEIDENQLVSNKKVKTVDDTCGGVSQPDVIRKKNKKKRDRKRKNRQEKMVKCGEDWADVEAVRGAIVINIGDLLKMMSNDVYKSVEHRVLANPVEGARVSVAVFLNPSNREKLYGPFPELISAENPAGYKELVYEDYMTRFFKKELDGKTLTNFYRIDNTQG